MSKAILEESAALATPSRPLFEKLVLKLLLSMQEGALCLTLPSGERFDIGSSDAAAPATLHIRRPDFFRKCALYGDIGFGESYVDGDWDTDDITALVSWMILNIEKHPAMSGSRRRFSPINILQTLNRWYHRVRPNTVEGSKRNIAAHYDLSNDFFSLFLDKSMTYSCAVFERPQMSLEEAQAEKYDRLCQSLKLKPTDHLLEIGTGWGGFAMHAAKNYGCRITTVTISEAQHRLATARIRQAGLSDRIEVRLQDYRLINGQFDKIVSIEMLEAVGHKHLTTYFKKCHEVLKPAGILALQVITCPDHRYELLRQGVDWIQKHIFPGSLLPSIAALNQAVNATGDMFLHKIDTLNDHYAETLTRWRDNLNAHRAAIEDLGFDEAFMRKWNYYFGYCEAAFRMRNIAVVQMVYTRPNNQGL